MAATTSVEQPYPALLEWLEREHVDYEIREHERAFTAWTTAVAEGVDPRAFAKVLGVGTGDGRTVLLVLDATDQLDLAKARKALGSAEVRLLGEKELTAMTPGCEVGAVPAVGQLFGVAMFADYAVRDDQEISFNAGSHRFSAHVDRAQWERASGATYADLAMDRDAGPAWAR